MGKASRSKQPETRQQKIAVQRAAERRRQIRNRMLMSSAAVIAVIAIVVGLVFAYTGRQRAATKGASNGPAGAALATVVSQVTSVPAGTLNAVGGGSVTNGLQRVSGTPLVSGGKPEMLYVGAEFCPYCAAERWAMIVALSRFGTFTGLQTIHSAAYNGAGEPEPAPNTPSWTFAHARYTSPYLTFSSVETQTNIPDPKTGTYTTLQTPTKAQLALISKYNATGGIPFIDIGNKYTQAGDPVGVDPTMLTGKSWSQIAQAIQDPSNPIAKFVDGEANYLTAAIAKVTGHQPAGMSAQQLKALEGRL